jgi:hypothetical protein
MTPLNTSSRTNVPLAQRSFDVGFRPDLVNKQACAAFNRTTFPAQVCEATGAIFVILVGG